MAQEFRREVLARLPLPLAQLYGRAYNAKDSRARHDNALYLFEALIKLAAAPAIAAYLHEARLGAPRVKTLDDLLLQLALPSLGQWTAMLRELARHFGNRPDAATHPLGHLWGQIASARWRQPDAKSAEPLPAPLALYRRIKNGPDGALAADGSCSTLELLEALVQYRNAVFGHGGPRFESFYEEMGPLLHQAGGELLGEGVVDWLGPAASRLLYVTELRSVEEGVVEAGLRELIGVQAERSAPLRLGAAQAAELGPSTVALLWPGHAVPLRLDPLLLYREGELADEVLFLNRERNGRQVQYLSYLTGKTEWNKATAAALARLLSQVAQRKVEEEELQKLAEHSAAEAASVESLLAPAEPSGLRLGSYEVLAELGRGGMGVVYLARQLSLGRLVALKMLPADLAGDETALSRLRREIRALARCEHPNIVKVLESGTLPDGRLYYTMEYVPGCDLEQLWQELAKRGQSGGASGPGSSSFAGAVLSASRRRRQQTLRRRSGSEPTAAGPAAAQERQGIERALAAELEIPELPPLPELPILPEDGGGYARRIAGLMRDAALALAAVHEKGIVHRDVKPSNLMLTADGERLVLMDFGLAKGAALTQTTSREGGLKGTLRYAAPEQLAAGSGTMPVDERADVRGLGATMWELLTRRRLFAEARDEAELAARVLGRDVPRLREVDAGMDVDLEAIVTRATERDVGARIQSAREVADYLVLYLEDKPLPIRTPSLAELAQRWVREHRGLVVTAAAAAVLVVATVTIAFVLVTASKNEAVAARNEALELARREKAARDVAVVLSEMEKEAHKQANRQLARLYEEQGWRELVEQGHRLRALPYLARAYALDGSREISRMLLADVMRPIDVQLITLEAHLYWVYFASFSPDGTRIVTGSDDNTAKVWESSTGKLLASLGGHSDRVKSAEFSPDGFRIVTGSNDNTAKVWESSTGKLLASLEGHSDWVNSAVFSPDGSHIVTGSDDNTAKVWESSTGKLLASLEGHSHSVQSAVFSPDGSRIVTGSDDNTAKVWDASSGKALASLEGDLGQVVTAVFGLDGSRIVTANYGGLVKVWDAASGEFLVSLDGHSGFVYRAAFSPKGSRIVTASGDHTAKVWDAATGALLMSLEGHSGKVRSSAFSSDGSRIVTASDDKTARVWDAGTGELLASLEGHSGGVVSALFNSSGSRIVTASFDGTAKVWDVASAQLPESLNGHLSDAMSACFSPDPDGSRILTLSSDHVAKLWDTASGRFLISLEGHSDWVDSAVFSPDGSRVLTASRDNTAKVWDAFSGKLLASLEGHSDWVNSAVFSPDGSHIVTGSDDNTAKVWESSTGKLLASLEGHSASVQSAVFSPDGSRIVTASYDDKTAKVWEASTGKLLASLEGHSDRVGSAVFSPDGSRIVTANGGGGAKVWAAPSGKLLSSIEGDCSFAALSPDGSRIVTLSGYTVKLWDTASHKILCPLDGHSERVESARFSPDGARIVTASIDETVRVWDVASCKLLASLEAHSGPVRSAEFSPDGSRIVTVSFGQGARVWDVHLEMRKPDEILRLMKCFSPWQLEENGNLVPATPEPSLCPADSRPRP